MELAGEQGAEENIWIYEQEINQTRDKRKIKKSIASKIGNSKN
jgi:predicted nucleic acid-binding protein